MKFNEKLALLRKQHGYSQENLAEKIGVSRQAVSRWEAGDTTPEMALLAELCNVFGVTADYLIQDSAESENDIPALKTKNKEIKEIGEQVATVRLEKRKLALFSAAGSAFASFCALMGIICAVDEIQLALACFMGAVNLVLTIVMLDRYFKMR